MKITNALRKEHAVFTAMFDELDRMLARGADLAALKAKVAVLAAGLLPHARIEDDILFPALPSLGGESGPIATMKLEHEELESGLSRIAEEPDDAKAREVLERVLVVGRQHFAKEDEVLFPMAEQILDDGALGELGASFAERRRSEPLAVL
jgi:iron-sulfur cluster repair protein YtfE (RIC family)